MRIKPLVVLSLVCSLSQAADTVASLGDSIKATQFVTAVDHTKLINGTTQVTANQNGTASIVVEGTGKWIVMPVSGSDDKRYTYSGGEVGYYSGVNSDALLYKVTIYDDPNSLSNGDKTVADVEFLRREDSGVTNLLWKAPIRFSANTELDPDIIKFDGDGVMTGMSPDHYADNTHEAGGKTATEDLSAMDVGTSGITYFIMARDFSVIGVFMLVGPIEWSGTKPSHIAEGSTKTVATVDQLSEFVDKSVTNGLASTSWVNSHKWDWATQVTNAPSFASTDHEHDHLTSDNGEWRLVQMDEGRAVVMPSYYYGENAQQGVSVKFYPAVPIEDVHSRSTNETQRTPMKLDIFVNGQLGAHADGYVLSSTPLYLTNKVIKISGMRLQDTIPISYMIPFLGNNFSIMNVSMTGPEKKTLVSADYLRTKLSGVSANVQTAEDARGALTNLITILKNL